MSHGVVAGEALLADRYRNRSFGLICVVIATYLGQIVVVHLEQVIDWAFFREKFLLVLLPGLPQLAMIEGVEVGGLRWDSIVMREESV